jgi:hypothetical protein
MYVFNRVARPIAVTFDPHADELQYVGSANVRIGQDVFDHVLRYEEPFNPSPYILALASKSLKALQR